MKRIQAPLIAAALITTLASCGGGGGGDDSRGTPSGETSSTGETQPGSHQEVRISKVAQVLSNDQSIGRIRSLDNGFGIAGTKILGTSTDGKQWLIHSINEDFYDINGSAGKYSAVGHVICREKAGASTQDAGATWQLAPERPGCGTESWNDGSLQYSDGAWVTATRGGSRFSIDGLDYTPVSLNDTIRLPSIWSSVKASGRTTGNVYAFNQHDCSVWVGQAPFNYSSWQQAGTYRVADPRPEIFAQCARFSRDADWFPGKPYIQFGVSRDGITVGGDRYYYFTAPADSQPQNWVWAVHDAPASPEDPHSRPSYIRNMFWAGNALVAIVSAQGKRFVETGIFISEDDGNTWSRHYLSSQYPDLEGITNGAYNCNTGVIAATDGKSIFEVSLPGLKPTPGVDCNGGKSSGGTPADGGGANSPDTTSSLSGTYWTNPVLRNDQQRQGYGIFVRYKLPQSQQGIPQEITNKVIHCMSAYESAVRLPPALVPGLLGPETFSLFGATPQDICMQRQKTWNTYFSSLNELVQQCSGMSLPGIEMTITNPTTNVTVNATTEQSTNWAGIKSFADISYAQNMADNGCQ